MEDTDAARQEIRQKLARLGRLVALTEQAEAEAEALVTATYPLLPVSLDDGLEPPHFLWEAFYQTEAAGLSLSQRALTNLAEIERRCSLIVRRNAQIRGFIAHISERALSYRLDVGRFLQDGKITPYFRERLVKLPQPKALPEVPAYDPATVVRVPLRQFAVQAFLAAFPSTGEPPETFEALRDRVGGLRVMKEGRLVYLRDEWRDVRALFQRVYTRASQSDKAWVVLTYQPGSSTPRDLLLYDRRTMVQILRAWGFTLRSW